MSTETVTIRPDQHVARLLPATAKKPEPARRINLLWAVPAYWFTPSRVGPHLAVGPWWRAGLVKTLAMLTFALSGLAVILTVAMDFDIAEHGLAQAWRLLLHEVRSAIIDTAAGGGGSSVFMQSLKKLGSVMLGIEIALPTLAIMVMPWCAGGDRAMSVLKRSLKNAHWAATLLIPTSIVWAALLMFRPSATASGAPEVAFILLSLTLFFLPPVWLLRSLVVGANRYVGEPDGPAFQSREPKCDACGYLIVGLPQEARCPECGELVAASLPGGRRQPTDWQRNHFKQAGLRDFFRIQKEILLGRDFFRRLPVHEGMAAARHFWWMTFLLLVFVVLLMLTVAQALSWPESWNDHYRSHEIMPTMALLVVAAPFTAQVLMMFLGCMAAQVRYGIRDYRVSAIVCYYGSALMWPVAVVTPAAVILLMAWREESSPMPVLFELGGSRVSPLQFWFFVAFIAILGCLAWWWRRLDRALSQVRYANV